jgi:hypothetical protein
MLQCGIFLKIQQSNSKNSKRGRFSKVSTYDNSSILSPQHIVPPVITLAKTPSRGMIQSPA